MHKDQCHALCSICSIRHQLTYPDPNRSKTSNHESHKRAYHSGKGGLGKTRSWEWAKSKKKYKTERATWLGRRTKEEIYKSGIKLNALRLRQEGRHQKCPASLRGGGSRESIKDWSCPVGLLTMSDTTDEQSATSKTEQNKQNKLVKQYKRLQSQGHVNLKGPPL